MRKRINGQGFQANLKMKPVQKVTNSNGGDITLAPTLALQGAM
jgi:hypothetical protein